MTVDEARRRYESDAEFHALVASMRYALDSMQADAYQLIDAARFAVFLHLQSSPRLNLDRRELNLAGVIEEALCGASSAPTELEQQIAAKGRDSMECLKGD